MTATSAESPSAPFALHDCALITLSTGRRAQNLKEFRSGLREVPPASLYHHFWGRLLRPQFDEPEYNNDFASWAWRSLNDKQLAERLSMVIPTDYEDLEGVRSELLELLDHRLEEGELILWAAADQVFHFLHSQLVIFDTGERFADPVDLIPALHSVSTGCIFYHFIDARRRTAGKTDDFTTWLRGLDERYEPLAVRIEALDPYFSSLKEIRHRIAVLFQQFYEERV